MDEERRALIARVAKQVELIITQMMTIIAGKQLVRHYVQLLNITISDPVLTNRRVVISSLELIYDNLILIAFSIDNEESWLYLKPDNQPKHIDSVGEIALLLFQAELARNWIFISATSSGLKLGRRVPCEASWCWYRCNPNQCSRLIGCYWHKMSGLEICDVCWPKVAKDRCIGEQMQQFMEDLEREVVQKIKSRAKWQIEP